MPADADVVEAAALLVDESALTGESVPVDKAAAGRPEQPGDVVSAGTVVVRGRGRAVVTATGAASAMGRIAALMATGPGADPAAAAAGRRRPGAGRSSAVVLCAVVLALGLVRGQPRRADGGHRDQPGRRRRPGVAARRGHPGAGAGRPADGRPARADPPAARGGDARLGDRAGHRQDRHPDRGHDGRAPAVDPDGGEADITAPATRPTASRSATASALTAADGAGPRPSC